jgi:hypothetical protein
VDRSGLTGLAVAVGVLAVATAIGGYRRRRDGRLRAVGPAGSSVGGPGGVEPTLAALGVAAGQVTLLQFSAVFCAPCRVASRVCGEVAAARPGVVHVEVDAESHLPQVRDLGIWRTPTVLVVDPRGRVAHRATGAPAKAQLDEAVAALLPVTS